MVREDVVDRWAEILSEAVSEVLVEELGLSDDSLESLKDKERFVPLAERLWDEVG